MSAHKKTHKNPHADSRLARFVERRVLALSGVKAQKEIAREAGFTNANMLSMIKSGDTKLALDRVPALAKALFMMAAEQAGLKTTLKAIEDIFGTVVTANEVGWLKGIRDASGGADPRLTPRARFAIRGIF